MAISISKYVDITSGVGGANNVRQRDLIGRLFTSNVKVPVDGIVEATTAADVAAYFGSTSEEYLRALFYFSFISKNITSPSKIQFARWANAAAEPRIFGARVTTTLAQFNAITTGTLTITAGADTANLTALDFSGAASLAAVAATLQTAIRLATGSQFTPATVSYDATAGAFNFVGSVAEAAAISVTVTGTADDIATKLGWNTAAVFSPGVGVTTITDTLDASADCPTHFGSFLLLPTITRAEAVDAATWNAERNVEFMFMVRVTDATYDAWAAAHCWRFSHRFCGCISGVTCDST